MRINRFLLAIASFGAIAAHAEPFIYTPRDLLLGMRLPDGVAELVVNLGPVSRFSTATPGSIINISGFTPAQVEEAFGTTSGILWSAAAAVKVADGGDASFPEVTLWATRPRSNPANKSTSWTSRSETSQGLAANKISEWGSNTAALSDETLAHPLRNTATAIIEPAGEPRSYGRIVGASGNLSSTFQGKIENTTPTPFTMSAVSRSDLYELPPQTGNPPGRHLGFFELRADGTMIFQASGGVVELPQAPGLTAQAEPGGMQVSLGWNDVQNETGYRLERRKLSTDPWVSIATLAQDVRAFRDQSLEPGTTYSYRIAAFNSAGDSPWSAIVTIKTQETASPPAAPTVLAIKRAGDLTEVSFLSVNDPTVIYLLVRTNAAGLSAPVATWPKTAPSVAGNGQVLVLKLTNSEPQQFYSIQAAR